MKIDNADARYLVVTTSKKQLAATTYWAQSPTSFGSVNTPSSAALASIKPDTPATSGSFNVAHGLACACCLPACLAFNRKAVARDLNTLKSQHGLDVEAQIAMWMTAMELKNPFAGQQVTDREAFIRETLASGSTAANPRPVTADDVSSLLDTILEKTATTPA